MRPLSIIVIHLLFKWVDNYIHYPGLIAASVLMIAPILVVFVMFQKNLIESVMDSGVKKIIG